VDLRHKDEVEGTNRVELGIDLSEFYLSVEWDILDVPAIRNEKFYTCCEEPYIDITFNISMRRKTLFYTVNSLFRAWACPSDGAGLYLPSDSGEKVSSPSPSCSRLPSSSCCWPRSSRPPHSCGAPCSASAPTLHHDPRHTLHLRHGGRAQRPLQHMRIYLTSTFSDYLLIREKFVEDSIHPHSSARPYGTYVALQGNSSFNFPDFSVQLFELCVQTQEQNTDFYCGIARFTKKTLLFSQFRHNFQRIA
ncbi:acetylcholine receptor subunit alpha-like, partial [Caerostris extrusa]